MRETAIVIRADLPRAKVTDRCPLRQRDRLRTAVRRLADVPVAGPGRIDLHFQPQPLGLRTKRGLGERRTTDVAETHEQHGRTLIHSLALPAPHFTVSSIPLPSGSS